MTGRSSPPHAKPGWSRFAAERDLKRSIVWRDSSWWYDDGRLYWFCLLPSPWSRSKGAKLGLLAVGYQVDSTGAQPRCGRRNQIRPRTNDTLIASTLPPRDEAELQLRIRSEYCHSCESCSSAPRQISTQFLLLLLHGSAVSPSIVT